MKIRPSFWRITLLSLILIFVGALVLFASIFWIFLFQEWTWYQPFIIIFFFVASLIIYILTLFLYYYVPDKKLLAVRKFTKVMTYDYDEIIYIDEHSKNKWFLTFITSRGDPIYLINDSKGKLFDTLASKCTNLVDKEELLRKFPRIKI